MSDTKRCARCEQDRPRDSFNRNRTRKDGLQTYCKPCAAGYKKTDAYLAGRRAYKRSSAGKAAQRRADLKHRYGITEAEYGRLLAEQNGGCAICSTTECASGRRLAVDHCHATGRVRGLLCRDCNTVLGKFRDDAERFERAAAYLRKGRT